MTEHPEITVRAVVGMTRWGKTTDVEEMVAGERRIVYYDSTNDDYRNGVVFTDFAVFKRFWLKVYRSRFRLIYRPLDPQEHFAEFCALAFECGNVTVVVDEADQFFTAGKCCREFQQIITRAGHAGIQLIVCSQRCKGFGVWLRSQCHQWDVFQNREPDDVADLYKRLPGLPAGTIETLPRFHFIRYVDGQDTYERRQTRLLASEKVALQGLHETPGQQPDSGHDADAGGSVGG